MKYTYPLFILSVLLFTGCLDSPSNPNCQEVDESAFLEQNAAREGVIVTSTGLQYEVIEEGEGDLPSSGLIVFTEYVGRTIDDQQFVNSNGIEYFRLNETILPGITDGLTRMSEGSTYRLVLPPDLGYGDNPPQGTPVNCGSVLVFDMTLDSFLRDPEFFLDDNALNDDITVTESGLQYRVLEEGDGGETPGEASRVEVNYKGTFTNGFEFDSSPSGETVVFNTVSVIDGFAEGLQLMTAGAKYELFLPPDIGYGNTPPQGSPIPSNVVLRFEVELVSIVE
ncbi:MAG TPA: FKBP-type peptidyl-prolyl cis-trans isomerase [Balneolaceae bacterium]|nr:FKBP-type peptidyl-prolyl cis-trans isomerase [Balneolaceae bacterium]